MLTQFYVHVTVHRNKFIFNKTNRRTNFSKFNFVKKLYMFRAVLMPIIRSFPLYVRHWFMSCKSDDSFQARSGKCLKAVIRLARHIPVPKVQWRTPDDGQKDCPKHVEFLDKIRFGKISAAVGFIKKKEMVTIRLTTMPRNVQTFLRTILFPSSGQNGCYIFPILDGV